MTLPYEDVFKSFLGYITDYSLVSEDESIVYEQMTEWFRKACSKPMIRRLFSSSSLDDDKKIFNYSMNVPTDDESDNDFVVDIIAKGMVIEWLQPQVMSKLNIAQMFGGKEQKFFSQSNHLNELRALLNDITIEQRKLIRDRDYYTNSYLNGE